MSFLQESARYREKLWVQALAPALAAGLALVVILYLIISSAGGDPLELAKIGTRFSQIGPAGTEGYDGQFVYYIARDLVPEVVGPHLDVPAYRYQRILLPLLGRLAAFGNPDLIAWTLPLISILAQIVGTWLVGLLILRSGISARYALVYGLWAGFTLAIRLDLPEPLAYALVAGAIYSNQRGWKVGSWVLYGLALFAKEVTVIFLAAQLLDTLRRREWGEASGLIVIAVVPFALFQVWLWQIFGAPGIGSGGANATPFELIPLMGFIRVALTDMRVFLVFFLVFGPFILAPALWAIVVGIRELRLRKLDLYTLFFLLNGLVILFLPFSTFREPGGLLRFSCGLVLAFLLYASRQKRIRLLNYSMFSLVLNVFLIE